MSIKENLVFIANRLEKLRDEERIRYEGSAVFEEARQELAGVIASYSEAAAAPAPIIQNLMTEEQLNRIVETLRAEAEAGDVVMLAALATTSADIIAACAPEKAAA